MTIHTQHDWEQIETAERKQSDWSARLADRTRVTVRNAFAKLQYLKSRYRNNIQVFTDVCLNMTPVRILASLREFKNLVKLLATNPLAWMQIPTNERTLIVTAAKIAGVMVLVPAYVLLKG